MGKNESKTNALAIVKAPFAALALPSEDIVAMIDENLGKDGLGVFDIERIKIPAGGILQWQVPQLEGDPEMVKALEGVIVYKKLARAYWSKSYDEIGSAPPECKADDNSYGMGTPGGTCADCPFSQFGSALNKDGTEGKGQACKQKMLIFLMGEEGFLPKIVVCPSTSISPMRKFFVRLMDRGILISSIMIRLELEKDKNDGGIEYSKVKPSIAGRLSDDDIKKIKTYGDNLRPIWLKEGIKDTDSDDTKEDL